MTQNEFYIENIQNSGLTIYDSIKIGDPNLWIPTKALENTLNSGLKGMSLLGLPLRTRSKVVKEKICQVLGYPIPKTFKKTQPRFLGQLFDIYIQKSNNLQVWNEELSFTRRYVIIRVSENNRISSVKVVTGDVLSQYDTTGTLTQKFQASCVPKDKSCELISNKDTELLDLITHSSIILPKEANPSDYPQKGWLIPIKEIYHRLFTLIGKSFQDMGSDQERNRGAALHRLVCLALGYAFYKDGGQFPDISHQLLEVKLQTSPTIDLGLVSPDSVEVLDFPQIDGKQIRHCDVRYAVFYANLQEGQVILTHLFLTTGQDFFSRFKQFQGKVLNKKLQIPLPSSFFDT